MKWFYSFLGVLVLVCVTYLFATASSIPVQWQPDERGGSFIVGEDTKSVPNIDRMYAATGATIYFNMHSKLDKYLYKQLRSPKNYTVFRNKDSTGIYAVVGKSGFSLSQ